MIQDKTKIKLSDVYWAYITDDVADENDVLMPVIVNKEGTRYKDLRTDTIHPTLSKITSTIQDDNCCNLQKSIAHNLDIPTKQVTVETSSYMLQRYGRGVVPYFANRTLHKYGNYIANHFKN